MTVGGIYIHSVFSLKQFEQGEEEDDEGLEMNENVTRRQTMILMEKMNLMIMMPIN